MQGSSHLIPFHCHPPDTFPIPSAGAWRGIRAPGPIRLKIQRRYDELATPAGAIFATTPITRRTGFGPECTSSGEPTAKRRGLISTHAFGFGWLLADGHLREDAVSA